MRDVLQQERGNLVELIEKLNSIGKIITGDDRVSPEVSDKECTCLLDSVQTNLVLTEELLKKVEIIAIALLGGK